MKSHNIAQKPHKKYIVTESLLAGVTYSYLFFDLYLPVFLTYTFNVVSHTTGGKKFKDHHHLILLVVKYFKTQTEDVFVFTLSVQVPSIKAS